MIELVRSPKQDASVRQPVVRTPRQDSFNSKLIDENTTLSATHENTHTMAAGFNTNNLGSMRIHRED
jgi:hypothetical protein